METAQQTRTEAPATPSRRAEDSAEAAIAAQRQSYQPIYVEPRGTTLESEARRAAGRFGQGSVDFSPSTYSASARRTQLGPELSQRLLGRLEGGGRALTGEARSDMERHFHRKLGRVRIDDGPVARDVGAAIDARAFALRDYVFFRDGFSASDPRDIRTLAHELTHVLQQSHGAADAYVIQRDEPVNTEVPETWEGQGANRGYILDFASNPGLFTMPRLELPKINGKVKGKSTIPGITTALITDDFRYTTRDEERDTAQRALWVEHVTANKEQIATKISTFVPNPTSESDPDPVYYLKVRATDQILAGTRSQLLARDELLIPNWNKEGRPCFFDVDHYREHQLEGPDAIENVWLLEDSANRSAGSRIRNAVLENINELFRRARAENFFRGRNESRDKLSHSRTPRAQSLRFSRVSGGTELTGDSWTMDEIIAAKHIQFGQRRLLTAVPPRELRELGLVAGGTPPTTVLWFLGPDSGFYRRIDISDLASPSYRGRPLVGQKDNFIKNFEVKGASLQSGLDLSTLTDGAQIGSITGVVGGGVGTYYDRTTNEKKRGERVFVNADVTLPLKFDRRYGYGAYIDRSGVRAALMAARAEVKGASPIAIDQAGLGDDWSMGLSATLTSTHPMFEGFQATVGLTADGIVLDVDIPTDRLRFGFFRVTEANLSVAYGEEGLLFGGFAAFELAHMGNGSILARGTDLEGSFNFDFDFVDPASITVRYVDEKWSFDAELGIKEGVVPGLQSGSIHVGVSEEGSYVFDGNAMVKLPGQSEPVSIDVGYSKEEGLRIGGTVTLDTSRWPAIKNATVTVQARYNSDEDSWALSGTGTAGFALPGVTGTLTAAYDDGGLIIRGNGALAIGNATGNFDFAIGNYPVNEAGEFDQSADPTETFEAWGGGSVSIAFGPYLTGTVGVHYTPEDTIDLAGDIALPPSIPLFQPIERRKTLVEFPRVEFPIFGVSIPVVGSIGVFGFIGGELRGYATIGPASIDGSHVSVDYTLGHPESAHIHGESHLNFTMAAGLELDIGGGLGLGAAVASLTGEVGITAALDLPIDAGGDLEIEWTPQQGLSLDLDAHAALRPSFRVGVYGRVAVRVRIIGEVWSERWDETLASFGSGLEVSVTQPASWDETNGLQLDFDQAEFVYPHIDIEELASDVMDRIV